MKARSQYRKLKAVSVLNLEAVRYKLLRSLDSQSPSYNLNMTKTKLGQHIDIHLDRLIEICQQWQIVELALFGSVLRDDFNSQSDIDILVSFADSAKITFFDLDTIELQFSKLFDRPVDLVTKSSVEQSHNWIRKKNILSNSKIIYEQRSGNTSRSY